jgi:hypothetical protein
MTNPENALATSALLLALASSSFAQQIPFSKAGTAQPPPPPDTVLATAAGPAPAAETNAVEQFFDGKIPDALAKGKFNVDVRLRIEDVAEEGVSTIKAPSYAPTIRTRLGYTTAPLYGFQGMVEGLNISDIGPEKNYNAAGLDGEAKKPVVADPLLTRLDQAWLGYSYEDYIKLKVGEQHLVLDNQRFIGDVDWRQNWQTYDAAGVGSEPITNLYLYYAYVWDVHRPFGNEGGLAAANQDFQSKSHVINISYSGWKYGRFVGYTYLLGLTNGAGAGNSSATYGGYFAGAAPVSDSVSLDYRAEYAWQENYGQSTLRYQADYYNLELGASIKPVAFGAGYEDQSSGANTGKGGGRAAFITPLATFHGFDGWADAFLTTPSDGLRNLYGYAQVTLPWEMPLRFVYHKFDPDFGNGDYGQDFDAMLSKKFGKHWTATLEYAYYAGANAPAGDGGLPKPNISVEKYWAQLEFKF